MVENLLVACVQQRLRLPQTIDDHRDDLQRFMRVAQNKGVRLVIFPELAGLMPMVPLLVDYRSQLLKRADRGRRRNASLWTRVNGAMSGRVAALLRADLRLSIGGLLDVAADTLWEVYTTTYGELARSFGVTVVAPSAYLPDPFDGVIRNLAGVFGPDGNLLGTQAKVVLHHEDEDLAQAGSGWDVIQTEIGSLGIMLGSDVLFPEVGRILAFQGAEILVGMAACPDPALYHKIRSGMLARMQDNQLFGLISFLVGPNQISRRREAYVGKSAIFAPQELTPRFSGVLVEMGNQRTEGVLSAEWDFNALRKLWESSDTPVRKQLPSSQVNQLMAALYLRLQGGGHRQLDADDGEDSEADPLPVRSLDDLAVHGSVTSRWPLTSYEDDSLAEDWAEEWGMDSQSSSSSVSATPQTVRYDDETDEMDALPQPPEKS